MTLLRDHAQGNGTRIDGETSDFAGRFVDAVNKLRRTVGRFWFVPPESGIAGGRYWRAGGDSWVAGFYSGMLWLAYVATDDELFKRAARSQHAYLVRRLDRRDRLDHDVGFLFLPSLVAEWMITGNVVARAHALDAADVLAGRYVENGRFIRAWNDDLYICDGRIGWCNRGRIIIDTMMNLSLLFWAAEIRGCRTYADIAIAHAETTGDVLMRSDGSTFHTFEFDPESGAPKGPATYQGAHDRSIWSRGQAWAIYGFLNTYRHTGEERFLALSRAAADYVLDALAGQESLVPVWDFDVADDSAPIDSSAGAIIASALIDLSETSPRNGDGRYADIAHAILSELVSCHSVADAPAADGLIVHGASNVPRGETNRVLPYGDFFFLEALGKTQGVRLSIW